VLAAVALATILLHDRLTCLMERHGTSMLRLTRTLDAASGILLIAVSLREVAR